jgi:hypothetical protein
MCFIHSGNFFGMQAGNIAQSDYAGYHLDSGIFDPAR